MDSKLIHNPRIRQVIEFDGLQYGTITPTDIDGCIEYHDKAVVFMEYKLQGYGMPDGQKKCLERLTDDITLAGREAVLLLCQHTIYDIWQTVPGKDGKVVGVYYKGEWHDGNGKTVKWYCDKFFDYIDEGAS